jgi:hypothetical protein
MHTIYVPVSLYVLPPVSLKAFLLNLLYSMQKLSGELHFGPYICATTTRNEAQAKNKLFVKITKMYLHNRILISLSRRSSLKG